MGLRPLKDRMRSTSPAAYKAQDLSKNVRNAQFIARRQGASEREAEERSESDKGIKQAHLISDLEEEDVDDLPPLLWFLEDAVESVTKFLSGTSLSSLSGTSLSSLSGTSLSSYVQA